MTTLLVDDNLF